MTKDFIKKVENFTCEHCGRAVVGDGYTNHCPDCLWSKHVDVNPGDRAAECLGMMPPVGYICRGGNFDLLQRCQVCGVTRKNRAAKDDNIAGLASL